MKLNMFDVIELKDNKKVIVIEETKIGYKVKDVDNNAIYDINNLQINNILHRNKQGRYIE